MNQKQGFGSRARPAATPLTPEEADAQKKLLDELKAERQQRLIGGGLGGIVPRTATTTAAAAAHIGAGNTTMPAKSPAGASTKEHEPPKKAGYSALAVVHVPPSHVLEKGARIITRFFRTLAARRKGLWLSLRRSMRMGETLVPNDNADERGVAPHVFLEWLSSGATNESGSGTEDASVASSMKRKGWLWPWLYYAIFRASAFATQIVATPHITSHTACSSSGERKERGGAGVGGLEREWTRMSLASVVLAFFGSPLSSFEFEQNQEEKRDECGENTTEEVERATAPAAFKFKVVNTLLPLPTTYNPVAYLKGQFFRMSVILNCNGEQQLIDCRKHVRTTGTNRVAASAEQSVVFEASRRAYEIISVLGCLLHISRSQSSSSAAADLIKRCGLSARLDPPAALLSNAKIAGSVIQLLMAVSSISTAVCSLPVLRGVSVSERRKVRSALLTHSENPCPHHGSLSSSKATKGTVITTTSIPVSAALLAELLLIGRSRGFLLALSLGSSGRSIDNTSNRGGSDLTRSQCFPSVLDCGSEESFIFFRKILSYAKRNKSGEAASAPALLTLLASIVRTQMMKVVDGTSQMLAPAPTMAVAHTTIALHIATLAALSPLSLVARASASRSQHFMYSSEAVEWVGSQLCHSGLAFVPYLPKMMETSFLFPDELNEEGVVKVRKGKDEAEKEETINQLRELSSEFLRDQLCVFSNIWKTAFDCAIEEMVSGAGEQTDPSPPALSQRPTVAVASNTTTPRSPSFLISNVVYQLSTLLTGNRVYCTMNTMLLASSGQKPKTLGSASNTNIPNNEVRATKDGHEDDHMMADSLFMDGSVENALERDLVMGVAHSALSALRKILSSLGSDHVGFSTVAGLTQREIQRRQRMPRSGTDDPSISLGEPGEAQKRETTGDEHRLTRRSITIMPAGVVADSLTSISNHPRLSAMLSTLWAKDELSSSASSLTSSPSSLSFCAPSWLLLSLIGLGGYADAIGIGIDSQWICLLQSFLNTAGGGGGAGSSAASSSSLAARRVLRRAASLRSKYSRDGRFSEANNTSSTLRKNDNEQPFFCTQSGGAALQGYYLTQHQKLSGKRGGGAYAPPSLVSYSFFPSSIPNILSSPENAASVSGFSNNHNKDRCARLVEALWGDWLSSSLFVPNEGDDGSLVPLSALLSALSSEKEKGGRGGGGVWDEGSNTNIINGETEGALCPAEAAATSLFCASDVTSSSRPRARDFWGYGGVGGHSRVESFQVIGFLELIRQKAPLSLGQQVESALSRVNTLSEEAVVIAGRVSQQISSPASASVPICLPNVMPLSEAFWLCFCVPLLPIVDAWAIAVDTPTKAVPVVPAPASTSTTSQARRAMAAPITFDAQNDEQTAATRLLTLLPPSALCTAHVVLTFFISHFITYGLLVCDDSEILIGSGLAGSGGPATVSTPTTVATATGGSASIRFSVGLPCLEVLRHLAVVLNRVCYSSIAHMYLPHNATSAALVSSSAAASSFPLAPVAILMGGVSGLPKPKADASTRGNGKNTFPIPISASDLIDALARYLRGKEMKPIPFTCDGSGGERGGGVGVGKLTCMLRPMPLAAVLEGTGAFASGPPNIGTSASLAQQNSRAYQQLQLLDEACRRDMYSLRSTARLTIKQLMDRANRNEETFIPPHLKAAAGGLPGGKSSSSSSSFFASFFSSDDDPASLLTDSSSAGGTVAGFFERLLFSSSSSFLKERGYLTASSSRLWWIDGAVKSQADLTVITRAAASINDTRSKAREIEEAIERVLNLSGSGGGGSNNTKGTSPSVSRKTLHVMHEMPHCIPFPIRAAYLRVLIAQDRRMHQNVIQSTLLRASSSAYTSTNDIKLGLKIRRLHVYSDAFSQLMGMIVSYESNHGGGVGSASGAVNGLLKARWNITFVDSVTHTAEAGIDHGGVFKEFIELVLKQSLDPSYGLFVAGGGVSSAVDNTASSSAQHQQQSGGLPFFSDLYPNPHAKHFLALMGAQSQSPARRNINPARKTNDNAPIISSGDDAYTDAEMRLHYRFVGLLVAKAVYEGIVLNAPFAPFFMQSVLGRGTCLDDLKVLDPQHHRSLMLLKQMDNVSDACLYFAIEDDVLGSAVTIDLIDPISQQTQQATAAPPSQKGATTNTTSSTSATVVIRGRDVEVTNDNVIRYIHLVANYRLSKSIRSQTEAFVQGLADVLGGAAAVGGGGGGGASSGLIPPMLRLFSAVELLQLIRGTAARLDVSDLKKHVSLDGGGYGSSDRTIGLLWEVLEEMSADDQGKFLQFCTGSSRPPLLGFGSMSPPFTVRRADSTSSSSLGTGGSIFNMFVDIDRLPSASTCFNLLKLPPYMNKANLKDKLLQAIRSGAGFDLS